MYWFRSMRIWPNYIWLQIMVNVSNSKIIMKKLFFVPVLIRVSRGKPQKRRAYGSPHHPRWCCWPSLPDVHSGSLHSSAWPPPLLLSLPAALLVYAGLSQQFTLIFCYLSGFSLLRVSLNFFTPFPDLFTVWPLKEIKIHMDRHLGLSKELLMHFSVQILESWDDTS